LTPPQLLSVTKNEWESCLADFYRDDWNRLDQHVGRMTELAARWKGIQPPQDRQREFAASVGEFEGAVAAFKAAVEARDADQVTDAMRRLGKRISMFEAMK
jgi:hypothetical protein